MSMERSSPPVDAPEAIRAGARGDDPAAKTGESAGQSAPPPRQYRRRLANLTNVRTALADVFRQLETNEVGEKKARTLVYTLATLSSVIEAEREMGDLEERLAALEEQLAARGGMRPEVGSSTR